MEDNKKSKKPSSTVLGANLRSWRKAYGLSLDDVAEALRISRSTVGHYETGRSEVPDEILYMYSDYLRVPLELLMNGKPIDIKLNPDPVFFWKNLDTFFPIKECELDNEHYRRACRLHFEMYERAKHGDESAFYSIEECWDGYEKAMEETNNENAVTANYLALVYFLALCFFGAEVMWQETKPAFLEKLALKDENIEKALYETIPEMQQELKEAVDELRDPEFVGTVIKKLRRMKKKAEWNELADYYIALQYVVCLVDNDLDQKLNNFIGWEMVDAIANVGNRYAKKVKKMLIEGYKQRSLQSVDDK